MYFPRLGIFTPWIATLISFLDIIYFIIIVLFSMKLIKILSIKQNQKGIDFFFIVFLYFHGILLFQNLIVMYNWQWYPYLSLGLTLGENLLFTILYFVTIAKLYNGAFSFGGLMIGVASIALFFFDLLEILSNIWPYLVFIILFMIGLITTPIYLMSHPTNSEASNVSETVGWGLLLLSGIPQTILVILILFIGMLSQIIIGICFGVIEVFSILGLFLFMNGIINSLKSKVKSNE